MKRAKEIEGKLRKLIETSLGSLFPPKKDTFLNLGTLHNPCSEKKKIKRGNLLFCRFFP